MKTKLKRNGSEIQIGLINLIYLNFELRYLLNGFLEIGVLKSVGL
jgi:hypothetical protein